MKTIKENYKFIIGLLLILLVLNIRFPYYVDAPGGISNINEKIEIKGYKSEGSFNLVYVKEYKSTIPTLLISFLNKDWKILKKEDVLLETENDKSYSFRDKLLMQESISDAIYVAYIKAAKDIQISTNKLVVAYISPESKTNLNINDEILSINGVDISSKNEITNIVDKLKVGDKTSIKVRNNKKYYDRYAYVINSDDSKKIGILISNIKEYKTNPKISIKTNSNESGSSGGLITALSIYNSLVKEDITHGMTIVGTGTIDQDGNVGSIGGVEYKLKSAVKNKADLFIVPKDENYKEAMKLKKKNKYNIKIIGVSTFDEVINYLKNVEK